MTGKGMSGTKVFQEQCQGKSMSDKDEVRTVYVILRAYNGKNQGRGGGLVTWRTDSKPLPLL